MVYSLTCEPQRSLPPHTRAMHANCQPGRLAPEIRAKASRIDYSSVSAGQFGVFISTGTGAYGSVTKPIAFFFLSFLEPAQLYLFGQWTAVKHGHLQLLPICIYCTAVFSCGALSLGLGLALSPMRDIFMPERLRHHPAANPRPRPVPLSKEAFFRLRDSHELLLFFPRSSTLCFPPGLSTTYLAAP